MPMSFYSNTPSYSKYFVENRSPKRFSVELERYFYDTIYYCFNKTIKVAQENFTSCLSKVVTDIKAELFAKFEHTTKFKVKVCKVTNVFFIVFIIDGDKEFKVDVSITNNRGVFCVLVD